jgi:spermidine/putrescine transport system permease protein
MVILIATAPILTSFLVKLVGLKTFFDTLNGFQNSTFGGIYTIIGLVYLYLPFMFMPLYTSMNSMPKNLINASYDLGRNSFATFIHVVFPYTLAALTSGIALVFLPSLTTVAVPQFMDNRPDSGLIGDIIMNEGVMASTSEIALARCSTLSLIVVIILALCYVVFICSKKIIKKVIRNYKGK